MLETGKLLFYTQERLMLPPNCCPPEIEKVSCPRYQVMRLKPVMALRALPQCIEHCFLFALTENDYSSFTHFFQSWKQWTGSDFYLLFNLFSI